ncbi:hypothetical protein FACS1894103_4820 [Campylobacterota bacterium]|nr:hypothetical protein FACS1894103_4820 [Campylobacterota bacterium]
MNVVATNASCSSVNLLIECSLVVCRSAEVTVARERLTVALTTSGLVVKLNEERKRAGKTDDGSDDSDD